MKKLFLFLITVTSLLGMERDLAPLNRAQREKWIGPIADNLINNPDIHFNASSFSENDRKELILALLTKSSIKNYVLRANQGLYKRAVLADHSGPINAVVFGPGLLASGSDDGKACIYRFNPDASKPTFVLSKKLSDHSGPVNAVAFGSRLGLFVTGSDDKTACMYSLDCSNELGVASKLVQKFNDHLGPVYSTTFSDNNQLFVTGSKDQSARVYKLDPGSQNSRFIPFHKLEGYGFPVCSTVFSPTNKFLGIGLGNGTVYIHRANSGEGFPLFQKIPHDESKSENKRQMNDILFNAHDELVAVGSPDGEVRFYGTDSNGELCIVQRGSANTHDKLRVIGLSSNGQLLAQGTKNGKVSINSFDSGGRIYPGYWISAHDAQEKQLVFDETTRSYSAADEGINSVAFGCNDTLLATGSSDNTIGIFSVRYPFAKVTIQQACALIPLFSGSKNLNNSDALSLIQQFCLDSGQDYTRFLEAYSGSLSHLL